MCLLQRGKKVTSDLNRQRAGAEKSARKNFGLPEVKLLLGSNRVASQRDTLMNP